MNNYIEKDTIEFIQDLVDEFHDCDWRIEKIVTYKEIKEEGYVYAVSYDDGEGSYKHDKQSEGYYVKQIEMGEDWYVGSIIYPINKEKALFIKYEMM